VTVAESIGHPPVFWRAFSLRAEIARRDGDAEKARRRFEKARALVGASAARVGEPELQQELRSLGERLVADPFSAYR